MKSVFSKFSLLVLFSCLLTSNVSFHNEEFVKPVKQVLNAKKDDNNLVIYNCSDYIDESLIKEFESEYNCKVHYYTYDTNETMYNQFTLQPEGTYDLICTSDYMIQKMVKEGLVEPLDIVTEVPNYNEYAATQVRNKLKSMMADVDHDGVKEASLDNYAAGYMWGTLGIIYDANCSETIREDVKSWDVFWNSDYKNLISIKNSMRDTFVVGLMHAYKNLANKEDLSKNEVKFLEAVERAKTDDLTETIQNVFDLVINEEDYAPIIDVVKNEIISLKQNIFGFEVDSGKNDIITGKIKMNLAWSGDAVYSIDQSIDYRSSGEYNTELEYYVPEEGGNVWYDGWFLPNKSNRRLATAFIDFLSRPENAARNMDYIGYTSFISGSDVFDQVVYKYGVPEYDEEASYFGPYFDEDSEEMVDGSIVAYNGKYYICIAEDSEDPITGVLPTDTNVWKEYTDELELEDSYDLGYIFGDYMEGRSTSFYPYSERKNQLLTQYPDSETLKRCAVMNDFESANEKVVIMWGQIRAYTSMTAYYVILATVVGAVLVFAVTKIIVNYNSVRSRRKRTSK